jgi:hypothetical protein
MENIHIEFGDPLDEILCQPSRGKHSLFADEIEKLQQQFNFVKITYNLLLDKNVVVEKGIYNIYIKGKKIAYGRINNKETDLLLKLATLKNIEKDIDEFGIETTTEYYRKYFETGDRITEIAQINNGVIGLMPGIEDEIKSDCENFSLRSISEIKKIIINSFDDKGNLIIDLEKVNIKCITVYATLEELLEKEIFPVLDRL